MRALRWLTFASAQTCGKCGTYDDCVANSGSPCTMYTSLPEGPHDRHSDHPASVGDSALHASGEQERLMAEFSRAALRTPSFIRAWERVRDDQRTASVQALLRIGQTEDTRRLAAQ